MSGPTQGSTCLGSADPPLDPTAANILQLYMACVASRSWARVVFETRGGVQSFDFSCQPSTTTFDAPRRKRRANARRRTQGNLRRVAWVEKRKLRSKPVSDTAPAGAAAAVAPAAPTAAAVPRAAAATTTAATAARQTRAAACKEAAGPAKNGVEASVSLSPPTPPAK
jgi:hypothetical protein